MSADKSTGTEQASGIKSADQARKELHDTLTQLSERLDYAGRIDRAFARKKASFAKQRKQNPLLFISGVVSAGLIAGAFVAGVSYAIVSKIGDD